MTDVRVTTASWQESIVQVSTTQWDRSSGWLGLLPDGDGPHTLVMVFGGSSRLDDA